MFRGDNSAHYLRRAIHVDTAGQLELSLGSDDAVVVWVGEERVFADKVTRGAAPDQEQLVVDLEAGENLLLIKIVNGGGPSGFYFAARTAGVPDRLRDVLALEEWARTPEQRRALEESWRSEAPELRPVRAAIAKIDEEIGAIAVPTTPIMRELRDGERRETHIHIRGSFLSPGERVEPAVPAAFHPLPAGAPRDRMGLARWLCDANNPLTPRVIVNRFWQQIFGTGLVSTSEDFGTQGERPSHPQLLDWLASELKDSGWSVKHLLRTIVTSRSYRQSSAHRPELEQIDPQNRLLGRGPRFRLEAEMIRDQALAVSGLLSPKMFGPLDFWHPGLDPTSAASSTLHT